ncbi:DUF1516 family protein [Lentilactobacillus diolivorans]|uniref:Uncharacterized protein n=2 Tax=Lentilactobacillus diolivorans TaxID=179838 RepID=A0A0R1SBY1_9LACO|nr:DUF1516 family protein [Lentilactobacillus diolivorans]KRL66576.1 hypothetical protein FC85_GL002887 [Lentilactobacillus diolivorans DSM 14421]GEP23273.1 hypothetical protein LDI01_08660 [Lentilactobacillus diolivorans]
MIWLWIHIISWVILAIAVILAFVGPTSQAKICQMIARVVYLFAIVSGVFLLPYAWGDNPILTVIKVLIALGLIAAIEIGFAKYNQKAVSKSVVWWLLCFVILVGVLGLFLSHGYPFIQ